MGKKYIMDQPGPANDIINFYLKCCKYIDILELKDGKGLHLLQRVDKNSKKGKDGMPILFLDYFLKRNDEYDENIVFQPMFDQSNIIFLDDVSHNDVRKLPVSENILVVETSNLNYQVHIKFPDRAWTPTEIKIIQSRAKGVYKADKCTDPFHPRKLPCFRNKKPKHGPKYPMVTIFNLKTLNMEPEDIEGIRFDPDQILADAKKMSMAIKGDLNGIGKGQGQCLVEMRSLEEIIAERQPIIISLEQLLINYNIVKTGGQRGGGPVRKTWEDFAFKAQQKENGVSYSEVDEAYILYLYARDVNIDDIKKRVRAESRDLKEREKDTDQYLDLSVIKAIEEWIVTNDPAKRRPSSVSKLNIIKGSQQPESIHDYKAAAIETNIRNIETANITNPPETGKELENQEQLCYNNASMEEILGDKFWDYMLLEQEQRFLGLLGNNNHFATQEIRDLDEKMDSILRSRWSRF